MADKYALTGLWSDVAGLAWSLSNGGAPGAAKPAGGEKVYFTSNSGDMVLDEDSNALASLNMTGYADTLTDDGHAWVIDVDGLAVLNGTINLATPGSGINVAGDIQVRPVTSFLAGLLTGDSAAGAQTIRTYDNQIPAFTLNNGAATGFNEIGNVTVAGNIQILTSKFTSGKKWTQTGSGTLANGAAGGAAFANLQVAAAGFTCTFTGHVYTKKFSHGAGTVDGGGIVGGLWLRIRPVANDFFETLATPAGFALLSVMIEPQTGVGNLTNNKPVNLLTTGLLITAFDNNQTVTQSRALTCASLLVRAAAPGKTGIFIMGGGAPLTTPQVFFGYAAAATFLGKISLGAGIHRLGPVAKALATADPGHALDFDSCYIEATGLIDLTDITPTNVAAHIECGAAGSVDNMPAAGLTEKVHAYGVSPDGGSNSAANIDFNAHAPPGSLVLAGAGI